MGGLRKPFLKVALVGGRKHMRITVLLMILCLSAPAAAQSGSIDPGERIAIFMLGMPASRALAMAVSMWGTAVAANDCTPTEEQAAGRRCVYRVWWTESRGREVFGVEAHGPAGDERVEMILTSNPAHRTEEGVGPGVRLDMAVQAYGPPPVTGDRFVLKTMRMAIVIPYLENGAWWPARGIGVIHGRESRNVHRVLVFAKQ